ncbi:mitochondrial genome maintenance mgm101 protein [Glomus cerebriforme]|uniref:Mitochondrial genome maintenance protein MGM101 n=1 Tax=Glomus cerebriforme TaxID=658196 RepID=A0A397SLB5_9GLOM|nr:mitochondrial genome maintenance mgm101 protein [Glomus cerebriforme]
MSFIKSSCLQKNVLANIIQQRTRVFSSVRLFDINGTKLTQPNMFMKTLIQQRLYATNSSISRGSTDNSPLGGERESASLLSNHESDNPASFAPTQEFMSNNSLDNQSGQVKTNKTDNEFEQDWSKSFFGLSTKPFPQETNDILLAPINVEDIECKPDGMIYLPEIKYRRILNKAFGPGGWGMAPRGENSVSPRTISREYALVCHGRLVSVSRGEQEYFDPSGLATAAEGAKSNALMRCCKDLGIASELWDPTFIRDFKKKYCEEAFVEHVIHKKKRKIWLKKGHDLEYPYVRT